MRINWHLVNLDMLDEVQIKQCPSLFRTQAECIIRIVSKMEPFPYNKMSIFDKHLVLGYWKVDGLDRALKEPDSFDQWFLTQATDSTTICRARRWLTEHNYLVPNKGASAISQETSEKWKSVIEEGIKA